MSVAPSPSSSRGEVVLQPAYFTSSAFVHAARADIDCLLQQYSQRYAHSRDHPFSLFKDVWQTQGWSWIQFKVFDSRSRAVLLRVVTRLFLERMGGGETPLNRAAALFGLYTMIHTQPSNSGPSLYSVAQVEVAWDLYEEFMRLPNVLDGAYLLPIRPHVVYVQSELLHERVFQILPHAGTHPLSPRRLPREVVVEDGGVATTQGRKKKGRPSRCDRIKKARESLVALDGWRDEVSGVRVSGTRERYAHAKSALAVAVEGEEGALREANVAVVERMESLYNFYWSSLSLV